MIRVSLRGFASLTTAAIAVVALEGACSSSSSSGEHGDPSSQSDASTSDRCALVGCAAPPPCGQACTAACGCCPNYECNETGPASDASTNTCDKALLEWAPDAGAACPEWVSANCCAEQSACANDPACKATVECLNACGSNGQNNCFAACPEDTSGRLEPLASCTKKTPDGGTSIPASCQWP